MIRTAIFSGSFNPIHMGHLMLANYIVEYEDVVDMWFVLSPQNPLKQQSDLLDDQLRLKMLNLALSGYPKFKACDIEFSLPKPSYTIHTLEALTKKYPQREFVFVIGADNWLVFHLWKDYQKIIDRYSIWIYPRPGYHLSETNLPDKVRIIHPPVFEISSTDIRHAFACGKDLKAFLPESAYNYIKEKKLYM